VNEYSVHTGISAVIEDTKRIPYKALGKEIVDGESCAENQRTRAPPAVPDMVQ